MTFAFRRRTVDPFDVSKVLVGLAHETSDEKYLRALRYTSNAALPCALCPHTRNKHVGRIDYVAIRGVAGWLMRRFAHTPWCFACPRAGHPFGSPTSRIFPNPSYHEFLVASVPCQECGTNLHTDPHIHIRPDFLIDVKVTVDPRGSNVE